LKPLNFVLPPPTSTEVLTATTAAANAANIAINNGKTSAMPALVPVPVDKKLAAPTVHKKYVPDLQLNLGNDSAKPSSFVIGEKKALGAGKNCVHVSKT
jgi:hypothetical protein